MERSGVQVAVVLGSPENLKITQPADLELAEFYLQHRNKFRLDFRIQLIYFLHV